MVLLKITFMLDPELYGDGEHINAENVSALFPPEAAEKMDKLPGLIWKLWCSQPQENLGAGFYLFATRRDAENRASYAHHVFPRAPGLTEVQTEIFDVDEALTRMTRGPIDLPANPSLE